jgi:hypothetical protein
LRRPESRGDQSSNGSFIRIVSSRSGDVDSNATAHVIGRDEHILGKTLRPGNGKKI